jgi:undecaprenol kinase
MTHMKNQPFLKRLGFAFSGLGAALSSENSFRFHIVGAVAVLAVLVWLRPAPLWWAVLLLTIMSVLALELINTALEKLADHLHPETHPQIKLVKDCAAAAVLVASVCALGVAAALIVEVFT